MLFHRAHLRWLTLLCLVWPISQSVAVELPPPSVSHPPISKNSGGSVSCRYRLEGLQTDFAAANSPEAHYFSLPAGEYTFQVNCDSPQLAETRGAAYSFTVEAPWWQQWLVELIGSGGVVLLVWGILWTRRRDRLQNERLERAVAERSAELAQANKELQEASLCDPLTGMRNRRFFNSMIAADASQAVRAYRGKEIYGRDHRDLLFFFIDIDHFKEVNDGYGHDAGDRVLVQIAQRLNRVVRESDFLIRWGGEEFLVVFRAAERNDGALLASRILKAVNGADFDLGNERKLARSCSVGWAAFPWLPPACSDLSVEEVLRLADRGLYAAKQQGRNQAVGIVPVSETPTSNAAGDPNSNLLTRPAKYFTVEQLLADDLIREVYTRCEAANAATG